MTETPCDQIAEEALIGCCIQSPDAFNAVQCKISEGMFYFDVNKNVYRMICSMHRAERSVNAESLIRALAEKGVEVEVKQLSRYMEASPIPKNAEYFADIVIAKHKARELIVAAHNMHTLAQTADSGNVFKILVEARNMVDDVVKGYNTGIDYYTVDKYVTERDSHIDGLDWGYDALDHWCKIPVGRAAYIGSISNGGKSTFMFNVAHKLAIKRKRIGIFTYEDSRADSVMRMNYLWYQYLIDRKLTDLFPKVPLPLVNYYEYRRRVHAREGSFHEIDNVCAKFSQENVFFFDKNLNIEEVSTYVQHIVTEHDDIDGIMLDYLQIIPSRDNVDGYMKMKNLVNGINEIARRNNIFAISACQMSVEDKDKEKRDYMRMTRVREARDIFHSCALFLGMHNQSQFRQMQFGEETVTDVDEGVFDILKNKTKDGVAKKNIPFRLDRLYMKYSITA